MKKLILLLTIVAFTTQLQAQKMMSKNVPADIKASFHNEYPSVMDVDWSKEGNNYEAEYDTKQGDMSVTYGPDAKMIEMEMEIAKSSLPQNIMDYIKRNYNEDEVKEASKITDAKGVVTYEAEVKGMDLLFDLKGNFIKEVKP